LHQGADIGGLGVVHPDCARLGEQPFDLVGVHRRVEGGAVDDVQDRDRPLRLRHHRLLAAVGAGSGLGQPSGACGVIWWRRASWCLLSKKFVADGLGGGDGHGRGRRFPGAVGAGPEAFVAEAGADS
jgi:hypothetical protein